MRLRPWHIDVYWYPGAPIDEREEVARWLAGVDVRDVAVVGIDRTVVTVFGAKRTRWGTSEMRSDHTHLMAALDAALGHFRNLLV